MTRRTRTTLADGRELLYFDDDERSPTDHAAVDRRDLPETATTSQVRYDARVDEWVTIASHRQDRTFLPPTDQCPLCPSSEQRQTEIPSGAYDVVVFENRFPSLAAGADAPTLDERAGLVRAEPGAGRCEVVCFTSDHDAAFSTLSPVRCRTVLEAWVDRTAELSRLDAVAHVFPFENRGREIGVTLSHPHGQIYAYPFVPPKPQRMLDAARRHLDGTGRNLFADLLEAEQCDGSRVVLRSDHWTAFVPFAARWPVEVHLYPNRRVPDLPALDEEQRADFCTVYLDLLTRFDGLYGTPLPYIAAWQQAPVRVDRDLAYLHLELFSIQRAPGKLKYLAGSETGVGAFINDVTPEQIAQRLRDVPGR